MKGFTLIELLVTITIIVLVTGTALAAYTVFSENRQLDVDTRSFLSTLNRLRSKSVFLEYPADCTGLVSFNIESELGASGLLDTVYTFATCSEGIRGEERVKVFTGAVFAADFAISFLPSTGAIASFTDESITISALKGSQKSKTVFVSQVMNNVNRVVDN